MRIPWPITVISILVAVAISSIGAIIGSVQTVAAEAAPTWPHFIASIAPRVLLSAVVVGVIAWLIERNLRRAQPAA